VSKAPMQLILLKTHVVGLKNCLVNRTVMVQTDRFL